MDWWVARMLADNPAELVSWVVWVIGAIILHELAHGWAAIWQGDRTPIETGHMTWNPLVHMGGMSLMVFALVGIAWGQMPVNPRRFRDRYGDAYVSLAGPAMNLALAVICVILAALWGGYGQSIPNPLWTNMLTFFQTGVYLNVVLCLFNLLPVPPLDGSHILASVSYKYRELMSHPQAGIAALVLMVLLFSGGARFIFGPSHRLATEAVSGLQRALPGAKAWTGPWKYGEAVQLYREGQFGEGTR